MPDQGTTSNTTKCTLNITLRAHSMSAPNQWDTSLQSNAVSHWLVANRKSTLTLQPVYSTPNYYDRGSGLLYFPVINKSAVLPTPSVVTPLPLGQSCDKVIRHLTVRANRKFQANMIESEMLICFFGASLERYELNNVPSWKNSGFTHHYPAI